MSLHSSREEEEQQGALSPGQADSCHLRKEKMKKGDEKGGGRS